MLRGFKNYFSFFGMMAASVNHTLARYYARFISYTLPGAAELLAKLSLVSELSPQQQKSRIHRTIYA